MCKNFTLVGVVIFVMDTKVGFKHKFCLVIDRKPEQVQNAARKHEGTTMFLVKQTERKVCLEF